MIDKIRVRPPSIAGGVACSVAKCTPPGRKSRNVAKLALSLQSPNPLPLWRRPLSDRLRSSFAFVPSRQAMDFLGSLSVRHAPLAWGERQPTGAHLGWGPLPSIPDACSVTVLRFFLLLPLFFPLYPCLRRSNISRRSDAFCRDTLLNRGEKREQRLLSGRAGFCALAVHFELPVLASTRASPPASSHWPFCSFCSRNRRGHVRVCVRVRATDGIRVPFHKFP
jgi:hypothetical protein